MKTKEELMPIITEAVLSGYRLVGKSAKRQKWKRRLILSFINRFGNCLQKRGSFGCYIEGYLCRSNL